MKKFHPYLVAIAILVATKFSLAQTTVITEREYWDGVRFAYAATQKIHPRRKTETYERRADGKTTYSKKEITEYQAKDTYRSTGTVVRDGKTTSTEAVQIGMVRHCRENSEAWKSCYENPPPPLPKADDANYVVQRNKNTITYLRTSTFVGKEEGKAEPTRYLTKDRYVLNNDMSARERTITTSIEKKGVVTHNVSKFEYGIKLKPIEAPIK